jgi:hypothetical protein
MPRLTTLARCRGCYTGFVVEIGPRKLYVELVLVMSSMISEEQAGSIGNGRYQRDLLNHYDMMVSVPSSSTTLNVAYKLQD